MSNEIIKNNDDETRELRDTIGNIVLGSGYGAIMNTQLSTSEIEADATVASHLQISRHTDEGLMISKEDIIKIINSRLEVYNEAIALYYDENNQTKKDPNQVFEWECSRNELNSLLVEIEKL